MDCGLADVASTYAFPLKFNKFSWQDGLTGRYLAWLAEVFGAPTEWSPFLPFQCVLLVQSVVQTGMGHLHRRTRPEGRIACNFRIAITLILFLLPVARIQS